MLFVKHHKMILKIIFEVTRGRWYDDGCLQVGGIGLYEAARRFDISRGYAFLTYAVPWIRKYVYIEACNDALPAAGVAFTRDFKEKLFRYIGYSMSGTPEEEIRRLLKVSDLGLKRLEEASRFASRPINLSSLEPGDDEPPMFLVPSVPSAEDDMFDEHSEDPEFEDDRVVEILEYIDSLPAAQSRIIRNSFAEEKLGRHALQAQLGLTNTEFINEKRAAYRALKSYLRKAYNYVV